MRGRRSGRNGQPMCNVRGRAGLARGWRGQVLFLPIAIFVLVKRRLSSFRELVAIGQEQPAPFHGEQVFSDTGVGSFLGPLPRLFGQPIAFADARRPLWAESFIRLVAVMRGPARSASLLCAVLPVLGIINGRFCHGLPPALPAPSPAPHTTSRLRCSSSRPNCTAAATSADRSSMHQHSRDTEPARAGATRARSACGRRAWRECLCWCGGVACPENREAGAGSRIVFNPSSTNGVPACSGRTPGSTCARCAAPPPAPSRLRRTWRWLRTPAA
jgi:hypothetical protein